MAAGNELSGPRETASRKKSNVPHWLLVAGDASWRILALGAVVYFALLTLRHLRVVVLPLVLGLFVAALLEPLVSRFERVLPRSLASLAALLIALTALGGALAFLGIRIAQQVTATRGFVDQGWNELVSLLRSSPLDVSNGQLSELASSFSRQLKSHMGEVASRLATGARAAFMVGSQILLTFAFSFFMIRDGPALFERFADRLAPKREQQTRNTANSAWKTLGRYLRGLSLIALANALEKGLALLLLGIPMVAPIMVLTFIGSFIPFVGPILAGAVAALVALAHSGVTDALLIIAAAFAIQIFEGNVLQPFILGKTMRLEPLFILAAVACGAVLAGLAGAFLAVPVLASVKSAVIVLKGMKESDGDAEASPS